MTSLAPKTVEILFETYQRLLNHLSVHAPTDAWAAQLLLELEKEAKQTQALPNGSYLPDPNFSEPYHSSN